MSGPVHFCAAIKASANPVQWYTLSPRFIDGDPDRGGWQANRADLMAYNLPDSKNNYLGCSSFYPCDDGSFRARKTQFAACHFLMLDDLGTKVPRESLDGFELSWLIETSPGNHQGGIIFSEPITDGAAATRLLNAIISAGFCDRGAKAFDPLGAVADGD